MNTNTESLTETPTLLQREPLAPFSARTAALNCLSNPKQQLSGKLRRQLVRNTGIVHLPALSPKDDRVRMASRLSYATIDQLSKWIKRCERRIPPIQRTLESAQAAGLTKSVNLLQIKLDRIQFVLAGFVTEVSYRMAKVADIAAKKAAKDQS